MGCGMVLIQVRFRSRIVLMETTRKRISTRILKGRLNLKWLSHRRTAKKGPETMVLKRTPKKETLKDQIRRKSRSEAEIFFRVFVIVGEKLDILPKTIVGVDLCIAFYTSCL